MRDRAPTIYDVAKKAGLSISTVSRVLNNSPLANDATRRRVMHAVRQLGFVPKAEASIRARKHGGSVGVVLPFFTSPSYVQRMRGVAAGLNGCQFELAVYTVRDRSQLNGYLDVLPLWRRLDGLILMSMPLDAKRTSHLQAHGMEVICMEFGNPHFCSIQVDNLEGGKMAARHLIERGRRRFAFIGEVGIPDHIIHLSDLRLEGYVQGLREAGFDLPDAYISRRPYNRQGVVEQANEILDRKPLPDAVFAYSDLHAAEILKVARRRGLRVPEELSIIGFDGTDLADFLEMTTIDQQLDESGRLAAELLMSRIRDHGRPPQNIRLQLKVTARGST
jgi:LacI family transcriptional regulator, galactose operon repressor